MLTLDPAKAFPQGQPAAAPTVPVLDPARVFPEQSAVPAPTDSALDNFGRGVASGTDSLQATLFGVAQLAGRETGIKALEDFGARGVVRNQEEGALNPVSVGSVADIEGFDDFLDFAAGSIGNALPSLAASLAGGGVGGIIAKAGLKSLLRNQILNQAARSMGAKGFSGAAIKDSLARIYGSRGGQKMLLDAIKAGATPELTRNAFIRGAAKGAFVASAAPQIGGIDIELTEAGIDAGLTSVVAGAIGGTLDALPVTRLIGKMFPAVGTQVSKAFIKDFAVGAGIQGLLEGSTEGAQEVVAMAAMAFQDPSFDVNDPDNALRIVDSFAMGALVGVLTGGLGSIAGEVNTRSKAKKPTPEKPDVGPDFDFEADTAPEEDFIPADNTFAQELGGRIRAGVASVVNPIMNQVKASFDQAAEALDVELLGRGSDEAFKISDAVRGANEDLRRESGLALTTLRKFLDNAAVQVAAQAQNLVGEERRQFIADRTAELLETAKTFVETNITPLVNKQEEAATRAATAGFGPVADEQLTVNQNERFVFGKESTGGNVDFDGRNDAEGFQERSSARKLLGRLREKFPSATDSTFEIREQSDGTFVVALADDGKAEALREDDIVSRAIERARKSARRNPNKERHTTIQIPGRKGRTRIDVPTLVLAGKDLGDNQTAEQAFASMTARLLERGLITNEDATRLERTFKKQFPRERRALPLEEAIRQIKSRDRRKARQDKLNREAVDPGDVIGEQGDEAEFIEAGDGRNLESEDDQARASRDKRNPKAKPRNKAKKQDKNKVKEGVQARSKARKDATKETTKRTSLPGVSGKMVAAVEALTERVSKLVSTKVRVLNKEAIEDMIAKGHNFSESLDDLLFDHPEGGIVVTGDVAFIFIPDFDGDPAGSLVTLMHEFGHMVHFDTWNSLSADGQQALWNEFEADVKNGKVKPQRNYDNDKDAINIFEFNEWMADQFTAWALNRKAPKTALEQFMDKVAVKLQTLYDFVTANKDRFGNLNETFAEFADTVARAAGGKIAESTNRFFNYEAAPGIDIWELLDIGQMEAMLGAASTKKNPLAAGVGTLQKIDPAIVARLRKNYPVIVQRATLLTNWVKKAYATALAPSSSTVRSIGKKFPAVNQLVDFFGRTELGAAKRKQNYHQAVQLRARGFLNRLANVTKGMTDAEKLVLVIELREMDGNRDAKPKSLRAKQVRQLFDDMYDYLQEAGVKVGRIENYFPRVLDSQKLSENRPAVIKHLMDDGMNAKQANAMFDSLIGEGVGNQTTFTMAPGFRNLHHRKLKDKFFNNFQEDNLESIVANYINSAVKRAEFNRELGEQFVGDPNDSKADWDPKQKLNQILKALETDGASQEQMDHVRNYVDANLGMYGRDSWAEQIPGLRKAMANLIAFNNMRVLLFTVFASLPDMVGPAIRSNDMKGAFKSIKNNISDIVGKQNDLTEMARTWGIISDVMNQHIMTEYVDNHYMSPKMRKWNEGFFKWTGLDWYTGFTRKAALAVGLDYIQNQASVAQDATQPERARLRANKALAELGLNAATVDGWVKRGKPIWGASRDVSNKADQAIAEALNQFVDESIMRPNASQRPILASHPGAMLVYHLKTFMYAMYETVLKRMAFNFKSAKTTPEVLAAVAPAMAILGLTAVGLELRELIQYKMWGRPGRTDRMDGFEYVMELAQRGGLMGLSQLAIDFEGADEFGVNGLVALGGPSISHAADLLSKPFSQTIPKSIPVIGQIPALRDALREATPL